jgi:hypothetical protein
VSCPTGPWFGRVLAVECLICGKQLVDDKCPGGHRIYNTTFQAFGKTPHDGWTYTLTIAQDNVPADARACCIPEHFPVYVERPTAWALVLEDRLVPEG